MIPVAVGLIAAVGIVVKTVQVVREQTEQPESEQPRDIEAEVDAILEEVTGIGR